MTEEHSDIREPSKNPIAPSFLSASSDSEDDKDRCDGSTLNLNQIPNLSEIIGTWSFMFAYQYKFIFKSTSGIGTD